VIRFGLVGYGYWGPNYARIIDGSERMQLSWCCDVSQSARETAGARYPRAKLTADYRELLAAPDCDAVVIAAPTKDHFEIARAALAARKHTLVEKPLTDSHASALELVKMAESAPVVAMTGHVFAYHPAVRYIEAELKSRDTGAVRFICSSRLGYSPVRHDVDALWDLAPHDISMIHAFLGERPVEAFAVGHAYYTRERADVVFGTLRFASGAIASLRVSWAHPIKERRLDVVAENKTFCFDDLAPQKVTRYAGAERERAGTTTHPSIETAEPLRAQVEHFVTCIEQEASPLTGFREGEGVVATLEALTQSMRTGAPARVA
jgi:predicted dehydrogenase